MTPQQIRIINDTLRFIRGDITLLSRQRLCRELKFISEHVIVKHFGTFKNFIRLIFKSIEDKNLAEDRAYIARGGLAEDVDDDDQDDDDIAVSSHHGLDEDEGSDDDEDYSDIEFIRSGKQGDHPAGRDDEDEGDFTDGYIDKGKYWYNPNTGDYLFDFTGVANIAKPIVIPKSQLHAIEQAYSNFDKNPQTISAIAVKHKIPPYVLKRILYCLGLTHDALPVTNELVEETEDDGKIVDDLLSLRQFNIYEKFTSETWKTIQAQALKWQKLEAGVINPITDVVSTFKTLPTVDWNKVFETPEGQTSSSVREFDNTKTYVVGLSDIHFGSFADKNLCFYDNEDWTIQKTTEAVLNYLKKIYADVSNRVKIPGKCVVISVGDILHSLSGFTDKGTQLITQVKGVTQFKTALHTLSLFFQGLARIWSESGNTVEVYSVVGNHDSMADYCLMSALENMFSPVYLPKYMEEAGVDKDNTGGVLRNLIFGSAKKDDGSPDTPSANPGRTVIKFNVVSKRWAMFTLGKNLFITEHGYSARYKSKVPTNRSARESYIQQLMLYGLKTSTDTLNTLGCKHFYFVQGDQHHYEQQELSSFEFIMLPTITRSDEYSDALNLHSRPRQLSFVFDDDTGLVETINHYFD